MDEVPVAQVTDYAAEDALLPVRLRPILAAQAGRGRAGALFAELEMPLIDVLVELEYNGIKVDVARLAELSRALRPPHGRRSKQEIYALAGHAVQHRLAQAAPAGAVRRAEAAGHQSGRPRPARAPTPTCWKRWRPRGTPLPAKIVEYRQYAKLKGTYVDALPAMVHPATGRVHASFNQVVAATGRLSSSDPNLQNIPVRTRGGARDPLGLRARRRRLAAAGRRLLADRAAGAGPLHGRCASCARPSAATRTSTPAWPARSTACRWSRSPRPCAARRRW